MEFLNKIPTEVIYVSIAAIGGVARYLNHYLNEGTFAWRHLLAHLIVSSFSGYMFYLFAINILGFPDGSMALISGLGGWLGVEAMKMLETIMKEKIQTKE